MGYSDSRLHIEQNEKVPNVFESNVSVKEKNMSDQIFEQKKYQWSDTKNQLKYEIVCARTARSLFSTQLVLSST